MRGDSLRDLYAKTLAVVGLGVLAGTGALVDYWPIGLSYPTVASTFSPAPLLPAPLTVRPAGWADRERRAAASFARRESAGPVAPALSTFSIDQPATTLGEPVELAALAPSPAPVAVVARVEETQLPDWLLGVESDVDALAATAFSAVPPAAAPSADESGQGGGGRGFVTGALSKTTSSLVRTGRWTGASIVGAVRVVRGVVGRAIPD